MIGGRVNEEAARHGDRYPWGDLIPILKETDLILVNLEAPLTRSAERAPKPLIFRADLERARSLFEVGIDVCNLANNHILDGSVERLVETLAVLERNGIGHVGAGRDLEAARAPVIRNLSGLRVGILGATDTMPDWAAGPGSAGVHHFDVEDPGPLLERIAELRPEVDLLVLTIHWDPTFRARPSRVFLRFARKALAAGADILHGHSAHICQGVEVHQGKVILYDTGDLLNDYPVDPGMCNDRSYFYRFSVDRAGIRELVPGQPCRIRSRGRIRFLADAVRTPGRAAGDTLLRPDPRTDMAGTLPSRGRDTPNASRCPGLRTTVPDPVQGPDAVPGGRVGGQGQPGRGPEITSGGGGASVGSWWARRWGPGARRAARRRAAREGAASGRKAGGKSLSSAAVLVSALYRMDSPESPSPAREIQQAPGGIGTGTRSRHSAIAISSRLLSLSLVAVG